MKVDLKQIMKDEANWKHSDFGTVAAFICGLGKNGIVEYEHEDILSNSPTTGGLPELDRQ